MSCWTRDVERPTNFADCGNNCHFRNLVPVGDGLVRYKEANKREKIALGNHSVRAVHSREGRLLQHEEGVKVRSVEVDDFKARENARIHFQTNNGRKKGRVV
jgi:hypothetical protein